MTGDDLRGRYAALFRHPPGEERLGDKTPGEIADLILAVRDEELERLQTMYNSNHRGMLEQGRRLERAEAERDKQRDETMREVATVGRLTALLTDVEDEADTLPRDVAAVRVWEVRAALDDTLGHDDLGRRVRDAERATERTRPDREGPGPRLSTVLLTSLLDAVGDALDDLEHGRAADAQSTLADAARETEEAR